MDEFQEIADMDRKQAAQFRKEFAGLLVGLSLPPADAYSLTLQARQDVCRRADFC